MCSFLLQNYNIFSDDNQEYSGLSRQFLFQRLEPFTVYSLVLEACTVAGCTRSFPQPVQTDEAPPAFQPTPTIRSHTATSVGLSWSPPLNPNGKITHYDVISTQESTLGSKALSKEEVVFTENDTESDTFMFNHNGLLPWTSYEYKIYAWNTAGSADSGWAHVKTSQAAPEGLQAPRVDSVSENPHQLQISWVPPETPNGVLQSYRLHRNTVPFPFSFDAATLNYTDEDLKAYFMYDYAITACTAGGCRTSNTTSMRTPEAAPVSVSAPKIQVIGATHINVSWSPPLIKNGNIVKYVLQVNNEEYVVGQQLSTLISKLQPYTRYEISLVACTNGGCTPSRSQSIKTMEALPSSMGSPTLQTTGPESIEVTWQKPAQLNGELTGYELHRDQVLVFTGLENHYHDFTLTPGTEYSYAVTVYNSQGSTTSPEAKTRTHSSAPSGVAPPKLKAWSSEEIAVTWDIPEKANGEIMNYTLYVRQTADTQVEAFPFTSFHSAFDKRAYVIALRRPYQW